MLWSILCVCSGNLYHLAYLGNRRREDLGQHTIRTGSGSFAPIFLTELPRREVPLENGDVTDKRWYPGGPDYRSWQHGQRDSNLWRRRRGRERGVPRCNNNDHPGCICSLALCSCIPQLASGYFQFGHRDTSYLVFKLGYCLAVEVERREAHQLQAACKEHLWSFGLLVRVILQASGVNWQQHCDPNRAGSSLKAVYKHYYAAEDSAMTLQHFILLFGALELFLSQLPDIHSLWWVNATCTGNTIGFAVTAISVTIYEGHRIDRKEVSYSLQGTTGTKIFGGFNALGAIAFSFGDAMLPEIQSTLREPARRNMYRGVSTAYWLIVMSYWTQAFSGYWAFGSQVQPYILSSLTAPAWAIVMANIFAVIQIIGCFQIYCRPTYAIFEDCLPAKNTGCRAPLWRLTYTSYTWVRSPSSRRQYLSLGTLYRFVERCRGGNTFLWGLCIDLLSGWFHPSGLCAASITSISEGWEAPQEPGVAACY